MYSLCKTCKIYVDKSVGMTYFYMVVMCIDCSNVLFGSIEQSNKSEFNDAC